MTSRRNTAAINLAFSYVNAAFAVINGVLLVPLYFRFFNESTYGAWLATGSIVGMLGLLDGGLSTVIVQRMSINAGAGRWKSFATVAGSGWALISIACLIMLLIMYPLSFWVPDLVNAGVSDKQSLQIGFMLAAIGTAFSLAQTNLFSAAYALQTTLIVGITSIVISTAGVIAILGGLYAGYGVISLGLGYLARGALGLFIAIAYTMIVWHRRRLPLPLPNRAESLTILRTTAPVFASRTGQVVLSNYEPLIVAMVIGPASATVLALTSRVYSVVGMLVNPIAGAIFPGMAHLVGSANSERVRSVIRELLALSGIIIALAVGPACILNRGFMGLWVGEGYYGGWALNLSLALSTVIVTRLGLLGMILTALGQIKKTALAGIVELVARLAIVYFLLPRFGLVGMPLATICGAMLVSGWYFIHLAIRSLQVDAMSGIRISITGLFAAFVLLAVATVLGPVLQVPSTWTLFFAQLVAVCFGAFVTVVALNSYFRARLGAVTVRVFLPRRGH